MNIYVLNIYKKFKYLYSTMNKILSFIICVLVYLMCTLSTVNRTKVYCPYITYIFNNILFTWFRHWIVYSIFYIALFSIQHIWFSQRNWHVPWEIDCDWFRVSRAWSANEWAMSLDRRKSGKTHLHLCLA